MYADNLSLRVIFLPFVRLPSKDISHIGGDVSVTSEAANILIPASINTTCYIVLA